MFSGGNATLLGFSGLRNWNGSPKASFVLRTPPLWVRSWHRPVVGAKVECLLRPLCTLDWLGVHRRKKIPLQRTSNLTHATPVKYGKRLFAHLMENAPGPELDPGNAGLQIGAPFRR